MGKTCINILEDIIPIQGERGGGCQHINGCTTGVLFICKVIFIMNFGLKGVSKVVKVIFYYLTLNVKGPFNLIEVRLYLELSASFKLFII